MAVQRACFRVPRAARKTRTPPSPQQRPALRRLPTQRSSPTRRGMAPLPAPRSAGVINRPRVETTTGGRLAEPRRRQVSASTSPPRPLGCCLGARARVGRHPAVRLRSRSARKNDCRRSTRDHLPPPRCRRKDVEPRNWARGDHHRSRRPPRRQDLPPHIATRLATDGRVGVPSAPW